MADLKVKISEFPLATESKDTDDFAILQDGINKKIKSPILESKILDKVEERYVNKNQLGVNNGVATLGSDGKLSDSQRFAVDIKPSFIPIDLSTPPSEADGVFLPTTSGVYENYGGLSIDLDLGSYLITKIGDTYKSILLAVESTLIANNIEDLRSKEPAYEGQIITLLGYYEAGDKEPLNYKWTSAQVIDDGGSVINTENGSWIAIFKDIISPLHFGAKGDGVTDDTKALKSCFDYGKSFDGGNKYYLVSQSDIVYTTSWGTNFGLHTNAGKTFVNFNFKTANNTSRDTSILAMIVTGNEENDTIFKNCTFNGNESNQTVSYSGREDGGKHLLAFYRVDENSVIDFLPTKNIRIENCIFKDQYSYGFFCHPLDCELHIEKTYFEGTGLFCCPFVTNFYVDNFIGKMKARINDSTKLSNFFVDEMEFGGEYTGSKKINRYLKNVKTYCVTNDTDSNNTFGIFDNPQSGLIYESFVFENVVNISPLGNIKRVFDFTATKATHSIINDLKFINSGSSAVTANPNINTRLLFKNLHFIDNIGTMDIRSGNANCTNVYVEGNVNAYALYNLNCDNIFGENINFTTTTLPFLLGNAKRAFMVNCSFRNDSLNYLFEGNNVNMFVTNCYYKTTGSKPFANPSTILNSVNLVTE